MNILIITHHFPPLNSMGANRLYAFAKTWYRQGHNVTILTTHKYQYDGNIDYIPNDDVYNKIEIITVPYASWLTKHFIIQERSDKQATTDEAGILQVIRTLLRKIRQRYIGLLFDLHDLWIKSAVKVIAKRVEEEKFDLLFSSYSPSSAHAVAARLKKRNPGIFWVADYRDLWSGNPYYENSNFFAKLLKRKEKTLLADADMITTVSKPWKSYLEHFLQKPVYVAMNGYDPDIFSSLSSALCFPNDNIIRIVYTGTFYPDKQNIHPFLKAVQSIKEGKFYKRNLEIHFYGDCRSVLPIMDMYGLHELCIYHGFVSRDESLRAQRDADALLYIGWENRQSSSLSARGVLSAKVFEYIASGTEIIAVGGRRDSEASFWILKTGTGEVYEENSDAIYNKIVNLLQNGKNTMEIDYKALNACRRDVQARKLLETIQVEMS